MISENLKALKRKKKLTRRELSRRSGLSEVALYLIETGKRTHIKLETLQKLSKALDVTIDELVK